MSFSTAVIGAGASGLSAMKALRAVGAFVTAFELQCTVGGRWNYQDYAIGERGFRSNIPASMVVNVPKDMMAFTDHTFPWILPQRMHHTAVGEYLKDFAEKKGLAAFIRMNTKVESVVWDATRNRWAITTVNVRTGEVFEWTFDAVVVASGSMAHEYVPDIPTMSNFKGGMSHSLGFKTGHAYLGQKVLIVGSGPSSFHHAKEVFECGASKVVHALRARAAERLYFKNNKIVNTRLGITEYVMAEVTAFDENGTDVHFADGSVCRDVDAIIWATGYALKYPFLPEDIHKDVVSPDGRDLVNCIHNLVYVNNPTLVFLGPTKDPLLPFLMREVQAQYIAAVLNRKVALPSVLPTCERQKGLDQHQYLGWKAVDYINMLSRELRLPSFWEIVWLRKHWFVFSFFFTVMHAIRNTSPRKRRIQHLMVSNRP